jgi:hypothetical protein
LFGCLRLLRPSQKGKGEFKMKRLVLLAAVMALAAGGAYAQCMTSAVDGTTVTFALYLDGCEWVDMTDYDGVEVGTWGDAGSVIHELGVSDGISVVDGNLVVDWSGGQFDQDGWWIWGWGDPALSSDGLWSEDIAGDVLGGGTCDGCDPPAAAELLLKKAKSQ